MNALKRVGAALVILLSACGCASAQTIVRPCVVQSSGPCLPVSSGSPLPITGSFSASAFLPTPAYATPISVSTSSASVSLPTGATAVLYNTGSVAAFCRLSSGAASATTSHDQVAPGGFLSYATSGYDTVSCITASSTTTVNVSGGSGTPSGSGGGGGAGGGGAITAASGSYSSGALASGSMAAGAMVDLLTMRGTKAAGTAAANALLAGAIYNSGGVTLTDGQQAALQFTAAGSLHTTVDNANANGQTTMSGSAPVALASNQSVGDPCMFQAKSLKPFTTNGTASAELVAVSGSTTVYACALALVAAGATTVAFTTGTGTACATNNAAAIGSSTANVANSMSFAANGGMTFGNGEGTIAKGAGSSAFCMINGTNVYVSGVLSYVQQ